MDLLSRGAASFPLRKTICCPGGSPILFSEPFISLAYDLCSLLLELRYLGTTIRGGSGAEAPQVLRRGRRGVEFQPRRRACLSFSAGFEPADPQARRGAWREPLLPDQTTGGVDGGRAGVADGSTSSTG